MNYEHEFHALLNLFASNARVQLSQTMLRIYDKAVYPFGYKEACESLEKLMLEVKTWQMPTPHQLIEKIKNKPSNISEANEVASRIIEAISRHGYSNIKDAKNYIGDLGWLVVNRFGGWLYLCSEMGSSINVATTRAQMRDAALSILDIGSKRSLDEAPQLPSIENPQLAATVKSLVDKKGFPDAIDHVSERNKG